MTNSQNNQLSPAAAANADRKLADARRSLAGYSIVETVIVVALICVLSAIALPQILAERRLTRSVGVTREILSQMRYARQLAMSQRQAMTFQYNNNTKQISILDHNSNPAAALFLDPAYPNTVGTVAISTTSLANSGLFQTEIAYGIPPGLPNGPLADGISMTPLTNNQVNVTFQPDGSVIDITGNPVGRALYIYNNQAAQGTASAISIMGASGRIKIWRYDRSVNFYVE